MGFGKKFSEMKLGKFSNFFMEVFVKPFCISPPMSLSFFCFLSGQQGQLNVNLK